MILRKVKMETQHTKKRGTANVKFIVINAYMKKNALNLILPLKALGKEEQTKLKVGRQKEIKIRAKINKMEI